MFPGVLLLIERKIDTELYFVCTESLVCEKEIKMPLRNGGCAVVQSVVDFWSHAFVRLCCTLVDNVGSDRIIVYWAVFPLLATKDPWC